MTEREQSDFRDIKLSILSRDGGRCRSCYEPAIHLAHRIAQKGYNIKLYGKKIIHHSYNLVSVCHRSKCNSSFNIGNNPEAVIRLVAQIREDI